MLLEGYPALKSLYNLVNEEIQRLDPNASMGGLHLVVIRVFADEFEANVARSALKAFGIETTIASDDWGGGLRHTRGLRLLVKAEDAESAADVLRLRI